MWCKLLPMSDKEEKLSWMDKVRLGRWALRNKDMLDKLKKTELWVTVFGSALLTLLTQLGLEAELAGKLIAGLTSVYVGSRGIAKAGAEGKAGKAGE